MSCRTGWDGRGLPCDPALRSGAATRACSAFPASRPQKGPPRSRSLAVSGRRWRVPPRDQDVPEELVLDEIDDATTVQIEQRDDGHDREANRRCAGEERSEAHPLLRDDELLDLRRPLLDRIPFAGRDDVLLALARRERQDARPRGRERAHLAPAGRKLDRPTLAMERALTGAKPRSEDPRPLPDDRVLEQSRTQLFLRLDVFVGERREAGEQAPRLQQNEP